MKKKLELRFTLEGGHKNVKMDDIHEYNQRVSTGCGKHKIKKGKGSYTRKEKHKKGWD